MRCGKLLAESAPQQLLEQCQCLFLEEAFLKLCETQSNTDTLNEVQRSETEDTGCDILCQNQNRYKQTKVYIEIIYTVVIKNYVNLYYFITQINRSIKEISEYKANPERQVSQARRFKALLAKNSIQFLRYYE